MKEADRQKIRENIIDLAADMDFDEVSAHLYSKDIFEKDHIEEFESKPSRKKRNFELLTAIQRKGPKAFQALYESLVEAKQLHLAELLDPSPPADDAMSSDGRSKISKPITQPAGPTDTSLSEETVTVDYKMTSKPLGTALIINNENFKTMKKRSGTDVDCRSLEYAFKQLGFNVIVHKDLKGRKIEDTITQLCKRDHSQHDCVAVVILSHGEEGVVFGTDDKAVEIHKLIALFNANTCPTLKGKPKLFFMQACRGEIKDTVGSDGDDGWSLQFPDCYDALLKRGKKDAGVGPAGDGGISLETEARNLLQIEVDSTDVLGAVESVIPNQTDMLLGYSTIPGFVSWRNPEKGSWFIQALTDVIHQYAREEDLGSMMTKVNDRVAMEVSSQVRCKQTSVYVSSLRKKLFFPSH